MSIGRKTSAATAAIVAKALADTLSPACRRICVAGSVRRGAPAGDIDILAIPDVEATTQSGLFGSSKVLVAKNPLHQLINKLGTDRVLPIKPKSRRIEPDPNWEKKENGRQWALFLPKPGMRAEIFLVTEETWGCHLLYRTGPAVFGTAVVSRWKLEEGGRFLDGRVYPAAGDGPVYLETKDGAKLGEPFDTPEEEDVFRAVGLEYVAPERRDEAAANRIYNNEMARAFAARRRDEWKTTNSAKPSGRSGNPAGRALPAWAE